LFIPIPDTGQSGIEKTLQWWKRLTLSMHIQYCRQWRAIYTMHVHTAGGKVEYTLLHVYTAGGVDEYTIHVHAADSGDGYTLHVHTAGSGKG
jgi:hypothetical protein